MNHQKIYEKIILEAKQENRAKIQKDDLEYVYYENHHIKPRCLEGSDDEENLI